MKSICFLFFYLISYPFIVVADEITKVEELYVRLQEAKSNKTVLNLLGKIKLGESEGELISEYASLLNALYSHKGRFPDNESLLTKYEGKDAIFARTIGDYYLDNDSSKCVLWYELAERKGDSNSSYQLGKMYFSGYYLKKNINISKIKLEKAMQVPDSRYLLGLLYLKEKYLDESKAFYHFEYAAKKGHPQAQYNLAIYFQRKSDVFNYLYWLEVSVLSNYWLAKFQLAKELYHGVNIPKDINRFVLLMSELTDMNYLPAQKALGFHYVDVAKTNDDYANAVHLLEKVELGGDKDARNWLISYFEIILKEDYSFEVNQKLRNLKNKQI